MSETLFAALLNAICMVESGGDQYALNIADGNGASYGYCQIKMSTAKSLGYTRGVSDLFRKEVNLKVAGLYLAYQLKRYKGDVRNAVAAYNAGSVKAGKIRNMQYVNKVMAQWARGKNL